MTICVRTKTIYKFYLLKTVLLVLINGHYHNDIIITEKSM